jgi:hypothetical protein
MEENVINLDELLPNNEGTQESTVRDITPASEQVVSEDAETETEGNDDSVANESSNEEAQIEEENITEGSVEAGDEESSVTPEAGTQEDTNQEAPTEPSEYKFKDDFIKKAVEYYETYGTLQPYLEAATVDYDSVSDLDLVKAEFDKQNSDLSERARTKLFEKELEKYNLDAYDEDDAEVGKALLMRDANKLRRNLKEEQQKFIQSIQPAAQEQVQQFSQEEIEAQQAQARATVQSGISNVVKDNLIKLEANGEGINYQVADTSKIVDYAIDSSKFLSTFAKDGNVDWDKWTKVVAFAENPTQFISELIKHGKSLGRKAMEAELKNVTPPTNSKEVIENSDYSNPFDNPVDFLKGMTVRK